MPESQCASEVDAEGVVGEPGTVRVVTGVGKHTARQRVCSCWVSALLVEKVRGPLVGQNP